METWPVNDPITFSRLTCNIVTVVEVGRRCREGSWVENSILVMKMNTRTPPQWYDSLLKRSPASHVLLLLLLLLQRSGAQGCDK